MGKVVHKKPQNGTEVVLRPSHGYLYGDWRLGVTVTTRETKHRDTVTTHRVSQKLLSH